MSTTLEIIVGGVVILIGIAGAYLITKFATYWSAKREDIMANVAAVIGASDNDKVDNLLYRVANVVDDVVAAMNSKFKPELLAATEDGKLTAEDGLRLRDKALDLILTELPESIWDELRDVVGDETEYVKTLIENSVEAQKYNVLESVEPDEIIEDLGELIDTEDDSEIENETDGE